MITSQAACLGRQSARPSAAIARAVRQTGALRLAPVVGIALGLLPACINHGKAFDAELRQAEQARRAHQDAEETQHFEQALELARNDEERSEALYRQAQSLRRKGDWQGAQDLLLQITRDYPHGERAARAWSDLAGMYETQEQPREAELAYLRVLSDYPSSGLAGDAARAVATLRAAAGISPIHTYQQLLATNQAPELDEELRFRLGQEQKQIDTAAAIATFEELARRHPLPSGVYTDEALLFAARLRRAEHDSAGALSVLLHLTSFATKPAIVGSYFRAAYVDAQMLIGLILRDDLHKPDEAHQAFLKLAKRHATSRLADDALWEAAKTSQQSQADACADVQRLHSSSPDSKYLGCAWLVCPEKNQQPDNSGKITHCRTWYEHPVFE